MELFVELNKKRAYEKLMELFVEFKGRELRLCITLGQMQIRR